MHYKHGHGRAGKTTRLFNIWRGMLKRCNPSSNTLATARYASRGITVCQEWREFTPFMTWAMANGYSNTLTIERKDVDASYSPDNCTWATKLQQARNRTTSHRITINGVTRVLVEWLEITGTTRPAFHARVARGWPVHRALATCPPF